MKKIKLYSAAVMISLLVVSCGEGKDTADVNDADNRGDTAVLVEDPNNRLDADPINDTTVHADPNQQHTQ